uniref:Low-density lipoprotein receptor-related protein 2-like n=1 Tax=Saccoglossus kowalevskii TaxID=10224 RepID=A0ABM0MEG7_SACKO|nr:PREDICTED: low-density lipoprotein receptor-related protein 2-like [Saccoglossus kowalevskii]
MNPHCNAAMYLAVLCISACVLTTTAQYSICPGDDYSIYEGYFCDFYEDCPSGGDEEECTEFDCWDGSTIPYGEVCDDSILCGTTAAPGPYCDQLACDDGTCVVGAQCNDVIECADGSDENGLFCCPEVACHPPVDPTTQITACISYDALCDGTNDCPGGEDEENDFCDCYDGGSHAMCPDGETCIRAGSICNTYNDCGNWEDEAMCR